MKKMPGFPIWKTILGYGLQPLITAKIAWLFLTLPFAKNCIKGPMPVKINRHLILSPDFNYDQFRKSRKLIKCSDVQAFHAIIGQAIKEYGRRQGEDLEKVWISSTFSMRVPPTDLKTMTFGNYWLAATLPLWVSDSLQTNIEASSKYYRQYIGSLDLIGFDGIINVANMLPYNLASIGQRFLTSKMTMGFSSLPSLNDGFNWEGMKSNGFWAIAPAISEL